MTQSNAILRHIGRKHNMVGTTEEEMVKVAVREKVVEEVVGIVGRRWRAVCCKEVWKWSSCVAGGRM